jgi:hypothetical protein
LPSRCHRHFSFNKSLKLPEVFFRVVFRRALDSRDCVVWFALAIRTRVVVVVATP